MAGMPFDHAIEIAPRRGEGQDRAVAIPCEHGILIAVADGAGGTSGGERAANAVIDAVATVRSHAYRVGALAAGAPRSVAAQPTAAAHERLGHDWPMLLAELDHQYIGVGQTTAVVLWVTPQKIVGASAGDSRAWVIRGDTVEDLTHDQKPKPLIGDGAIVTPLAGGPLGDGTLLVASDGLFRFAKQADIARIANGPDLAAAARALVELVRLPTGQVPDDVSIVICRATAS